MSGLSATLLYFLFDRELYFILHSEFLSAIYALLSKVAFCIVCMLALNKTHINNRYKAVLCVLLPVIEVIGSTLVNNGDLRRAVMMVYPLIGLMLLIMVQCTTKTKIVSFVHNLSNLYFGLCAINFLFLIMLPRFFFNHGSGGEIYFLGIENQIGYPLVKGFCFVYLDSFFSHKHTKLYLYAIMHCVTIFFIFSGSNVVGYLCMLAIMTKTPLRKIITSIAMDKIIALFMAIICGLFLFELLVSLLESAWVEYIVVELLGKNLTLTNRTNIWATVVSDFFTSPWLGYGVRDTVNLFEYRGFYFSAHNQFLQSLYESGALYFASLIPVVKLFSDCLSRSVAQVRAILSAVFLATMIMFLGEAPGMDKILLLIIVSIGISGYFIPRSTSIYIQ